MGICCLNNRKDSIKNEKVPSQKFFNPAMLSKLEEEQELVKHAGIQQKQVEDMMSDEQALKEMYTCASKEEDLEKLISLIENQSSCFIDDSSLLNHSSFLNPTTVGELVVIQMKYILDKKIKGFNLEHSCIFLSGVSSKFTTDVNHSNEREFVSYLKLLNFANIMINQLSLYQSELCINTFHKTKPNSSSFVKAFYALLNLNLLTSNRLVNINILANGDILRKLINYLHFLLLPSNLSELQVDHSVICIVLISNIFIVDEDLRLAFLQEDGTSIIKKCLRSSNLKLNQRGLCIIEDLIYDEVECFLLKPISNKLKSAGIEMLIFDFVSDLKNNIHENKEQMLAKKVLELGERLFLAFNAFN